MTYRPALTALAAYEPRALIRGSWWSPAGRCALGACAPEETVCLGAQTWKWCVAERRIGFLEPLGLSVAEAAALVRCNDGGRPDETDARRYERVVAWLTAQVATSRRE